MRELKFRAWDKVKKKWIHDTKFNRRCKMTVSELIKILQEFDPSMTVVKAHDEFYYERDKDSIFIDDVNYFTQTKENLRTCKNGKVVII